MTAFIGIFEPLKYDVNPQPNTRLLPGQSWMTVEGSLPTNPSRVATANIPIIILYAQMHHHKEHD